MSKPGPKNDEPTFEDAMQRLDEIVAGMEDGRPTLDAMISSYEEGVGLLKLCRQRIDNARRRVELISGDLDGGRTTLVPFEDSAADEAIEQSNDRSRPPARRRKAASEEGGEIRLF